MNVKNQFRGIMQEGILTGSTEPPSNNELKASPYKQDVKIEKSAAEKEIISLLLWFRTFCAGC